MAAISAAIAPKIDSALRCLRRASRKSALKSGRMSKRLRGWIWPAITARLAPDFSRNASIFPSWPTRIHSIPSTTCASAGSVSPVKAAATIRDTPAARAERAMASG